MISLNNNDRSGLALAGPGGLAVAIFFLVISNFCFGSGENLIAPFLPELADEQHLGKVSGWGWSLGFVGGLASLGACLAYISWAQARGEGAADFVPVLSNFWLDASYIDATVGWQVREMVPFVSINPTTCDFRLTLTSGTPVTTADVTAATTVYCAPINGNRIALFDASDGWGLLASAQVSVAVSRGR